MKYCPECKCEYEDWASACSDCQVPLVDELPEILEPQANIKQAKNFKPLLYTYNDADIAF